MAPNQQVGFSQRVQLPWLEYTAQLALAGKSREEANAALQDLLQDKLSVGHQVQRGNREKAITILLKIWLDPPRHVTPLRDEGLQIFQNLPARQHLALHWGMSMAVYPFFGGVAGVVGKLLRLQDQIGTSQVQRRIREQLGERETVARAARRIYRSFIDWEVLSETGTKGVYKRSTLLRVSNPQLLGWLYECLLSAIGAGWTPRTSLPGHAYLFPFDAGGSMGELLDTRPRLEIARHGIDQQMVRITPIASR